jgi:hypothetical protein
MKRILITLISIMFLVSCSSKRAATKTDEQNNSFRGFATIAPIEDADPAKREKRELKIPAELNIERDETSISVSLNTESLKTISLDVGENMVTGFEENII